MEQPRDDVNRFDLKGDEPRIMRSMRLTDRCWFTLERVGKQSGASRSDLIEAYADRLAMSEGLQEGTIPELPNNAVRTETNVKPTSVTGQACLSSSSQTLAQLGEEVIKDPIVTRNGKDTGAVRRAIAALLERMK